MKTTVKYYKEVETNETLAVFINTLNKGILDVYSPTDGHTRASFNYVVSLPEASKAEKIRMKKLLQAIGYINV